MDDIQVTSLNLYRYPQKLLQEIDSNWIAFYIKGFKKLSLFSLTGEKIFDLDKGGIPIMMVAVPGMKTEFEAVKGRENWVLMFNTNKMRASKNANKIDFHCNDVWVPIPSVTRISEGYVSHWQNEFQLMLNAYMHPVPFNIMRLELGVMNVVRFFMDNAKIIPTEKPGPAEKLKTLIDEDISLRHNISELSDICGYSSDHLRILFQGKYHTSPLAYRNRQRMVNIMDLIINTELSLKDIAEKVGFPHQTHFCTAFKKEFGITPAQAKGKYRG